jgi:hypothetical protein
VNNGDYWLAHWIDENGIRSTTDARRLLQNRAARDALREDISAIPWTVEPLQDDASKAMLAGRTIDLSGELACYDPECLRKDVDYLFSRAWHYFDTIVVVGLAPVVARELLDSFGNFEQTRFLGFVENFLYVREIGAENMLVYRQKPPACVDHLEQHAKESGTVRLLDQKKTWRERLAVTGRIRELKQHGDHWHYVVFHPDIEHMAQGIVRPGRRKAAAAIENLVFDDVFATYAANLVSDIWAARTLGCTLGSSVAIHEELLDQSSIIAPKVQDVIFELALPFIDRLPTRELIRLREDNWEYFEAFRTKLTAGATELLKNVVDSPQATADFARRIEDDLIMPELHNIERQLRVASDLLSRKFSASVAVGLIGTAVGLLTRMPLVAAGGVAATGTALVDYKNYVDGKRDVRMSDMYFLWNAMRVAQHGKH